MHLPPAVARLLFWLAALLPLPALSWNAAGHRIAAAIAWQELGDGERAAVLHLLAAHPDAARWERRLRPGDERGLLLITEASTWADDIRRDQRFFDPGRDAETPLLPGFPEMDRHRDWHFLNLPVGGKPRRATADGQLDRQIRRLAERLADPRGKAADRAWALVWLLHLVADLHQPLHVGTRIDARGDDDGGGNGLAVLDPDNTRRPETNLHAFWDELPGPPWLRGPRLLAAAERLRGSVRPAGREALDPDRWRDESYQLAQTQVYPAAATVDGQPLVLDPDYRRNARSIAAERVGIAGIRLGRLLAVLLSAR